ncbi:MAG TPA: HAMP domain-containing sensor histidine kinase [Acidimicrobiales bacterium]|nr:HAMP domain-containing sensor histidine kinase [Acidimicrobiales bacterium]
MSALTQLRRISLRSRLAALTAVAVGLTVAVAALLSYALVRHDLGRQVNAQLSSDLAVATSPRFDQGGTIDPLRSAPNLARYRQDLLQVVGTDGPVVGPAAVGGASLPVTPGDLAVVRSGSSTPVLSTRKVGDTVYRVETVGGFDDAQTGAPLAIQVAHPVTDDLRLLRELGLVLALVALGGVAVAVAAGYAVARASLRPVERLTAAAEHVAATQDLAAAIDDDGHDELSRLAQAFNRMLGALRASRQQQAQLVSDAGHELRTPLTSLRTNIEVLLSVEQMPERDRADLLGDVHAQLEELTTLIGDLVELGRQDEQQADPTEVRLDGVVERAVERARRRAHGSPVAVDLDLGSVRGQPALLERAVLNLLDNAVKFSPPGAPVEVTLRRGERWVLEVRDHGPGIDPVDLPHVFDRFYRASAARQLPGSGLGLAIVAQVVAAHGGTVRAIRPPDGGTLVRVELPTVIEADPGDDLPAGLGAGPPAGHPDGPPAGAPVAPPPRRPDGGRSPAWALDPAPPDPDLEWGEAAAPRE